MSSVCARSLYEVLYKTQQETKHRTEYTECAETVILHLSISHVFTVRDLDEDMRVY